MADREKALASKAKGNKAFSAGDYPTAIKEYTEAISFDATDAAFYSNRSACYASSDQFDKALEDGNKCVELRPEWAKGYNRKGLALYNLKKFEDAKTCYEAGLAATKDEAFNAEISRCESALKPANPLGSLFGADMWPKLMNNPTTRQWMDDPAFIQKMKMLQTNPSMMGSMGSDPQLSQAISVILGMNISSPGGGAGGPFGGEDAEPMEEGDDDEEIEVSSAGVKRNNTCCDDTGCPDNLQKTPVNKAPEAKKPEPVPEPVPELTEEEKKEIEDKKQALKKKGEGNAFYKKRKFAEAMGCYNSAIELDPKNCIYYNNLAAARFENKEYDECIKVCLEAVKVAQSNRGDFKDVAKAYGRIGNANLRMDKLDEAVEAFKKSLLEDSNDKVKRALKKAEELIKKKAKEAYLDKDLSMKHKALGNEHYKAAKWVDAIKEYTEALKRDPTNFPVYSNRAACFTKLMDWNSGLEDCEACLKIEPTFVKAYIRKGKIQHFLKQYHKALTTYEQGLALDPKCTDLLEGRALTMRTINSASTSGAADPQRVQEAMKDPEIQAILRDPMVNNVLKQMSESPAVAQRAMADPAMRSKIEKLIAAGVVQVGR